VCEGEAACEKEEASEVEEMKKQNVEHTRSRADLRFDMERVKD
jgi:hypothetical protein